MVCWVVITALQIIEPGFDVVVISTVAQGVPVGQGGAGGLLIHQAVAVAVRNANQLAPGIVSIGDVDLFRPANEIPVGILHRHGAEDFNHVSLLIQSIEIVDEAGTIIGGILDCKGGASRPPPVAGAREVQRVAATRRLARTALPPDARAAVATGSALGILSPKGVARWHCA